MENWQFILYDAMQTNVSPFISALFFISWIFIGNFMLLNLFLAILLDSFVEVDEAENIDKLPPDLREEYEKKKLEELMKL